MLISMIALKAETILRSLNVRAFPACRRKITLYIMDCCTCVLKKYFTHGVKVIKSAIMNIFRGETFTNHFKIELSYALTINLFTTAETAWNSELSYKKGVFSSW